MRRISVLLLLMASIPMLFASVFKSNELGQKLEECDSVSSNGTYLRENDGISSLIIDGSVVWTETTAYSSQGEVLRSRVYSALDEEIQWLYMDGRLVKETRTVSGVPTVTNYAYSDGRLVFSSTKTGEGELSVQSFLRNTDSGQILGISENGTYRLMSDSFLVQEGKVLQSPVPGLVVSGDHLVLEDGDIRISEDNGNVSVYSPQGLVLKRSSGNIETLYHYNDGVLDCIENIDGNRTEIENYEDGRAVSLYSYEDGNLTSTTAYREEGNIRTIYSQGRVIAVVYYRKDNRTVDRIEYN